jgi:peptidoglycan/xylan/chitin deacetylase (PgdA/CDA1 family)
MLLGRAAVAQSLPVRAIAVTFDDLPVAGPVPWTDRDQVFSRLLAAIVRNRIPAIGFVNEFQLGPLGEPDPAETARLRAWRDAGLELGNHTFSHPDLNRMPLAEFERQIVDGERVTRALLKERGRRPRFFRHPFLHTGRSIAVRDSLTRFLTEHGYRVAPVTDDNSDWIFASAYEHALGRGDTATVARIAAAYIPYMESKVAYWERQSTALFGREIRQVLLIHANRLNADRLAQLIGMFKGRGYRMISLEEALADSVYTTPESYSGPAGISWLHRWALSRGRGLVLPDEPTTPEWIMREAGVTSE